MTMKNIYYFLAFLLLAGWYSCKKSQLPAAVNSSGSTTSQTTTKATTKQTYVYVLGTEGGVTKYWKNGVPVVLSTSANVHLSAIAVSGTDVYAVGYQGMTNNTTAKQAIYYKNGTLVTLAASQYYSAATSIAISGGNVYIGGIEGTVPTNALAQYWKNGTAVTLPAVTSGYAQFYFDALIFVSGTNIYVAGSGAKSQVHGHGQLTPQSVCNYWNPDGSIVYLTEGANPAGVNSIFVSGTDVYTAGSYKAIAAYWKDNTPVSLTDSTPYATFTGIAVSGTNVYVAGSKGGIAKYWKNGSAVNLSNGSLTAAANSITLLGTDIYIAGNDGPTAKYWKNGTAVSLTDGTSTAVANSIFVITQ
jgi:hypothetical protein